MTAHAQNEALQRLEQQRELYARTLRDTVRQLEARTGELGLIRKLGALFERSSRLEDLVCSALPMFLDVSDAENASILLHNPDTGELNLLAAIGRREGRVSYHGPGGYERRMFARGEGVAGWCLENEQPALCSNVARDTRFQSDPDRIAVGCLACLPLRVESGVLGVVNLSHPDPGTLSAARLPIWSILVAYLAVGISHARLFEKLRDANRELARQVRERTRHLEEANRSLAEARSELARHNERLQERVEERTEQLQSALEELRTQHAALEEAHRIKDEFLNNINHELKTPLNAIIGYAGLMLKDPQAPLTETQRADLALIEANGKHLQQILENIFSLKDIESGGLEVDATTVDLNELVGSAVASVRPRATEKGLEFTFAPSDLPPVRVDPTLILRVLFNLLDNAVKFSSEGTVRVTTRLDHRHPEQPENACSEDQGGRPFAVVEVSDQGRGIRPEDLDRVFLKFHQAESATRKTEAGSGLGLTIAKNLVELHGGRIWVTSQPGLGSTFSFALPLGP